MGGQNPRIEQLPATYCPEIEVVRPNLILVHPGRQLLAVMDEFGAARAEGWTDGGQQTVRGHAILFLQTLNCLADDAEHAAPPAAMDSGNNSRLRRPKEDGLAVGLLNQQARSREGGDHGVISRQFSPSLRLPVNHEDPVAMDLMDCHQLIEPKGRHSMGPIRLHPIGLVFDMIAEIQGSKRPVARSSGTGEHAVRDLQQVTGESGRGRFLKFHRRHRSKKGKALRAFP